MWLGTPNNYIITCRHINSTYFVRHNPLLDSYKSPSFQKKFDICLFAADTYHFVLFTAEYTPIRLNVLSALICVSAVDLCFWIFKFRPCSNMCVDRTGREEHPNVSTMYSCTKQSNSNRRL